jgi:hypothetical protein
MILQKKKNFAMQSRTGHFFVGLLPVAKRIQRTQAGCKRFEQAD